MKRASRRLQLMSLLVVLIAGVAHAEPVYPVKVGPTGRYLVDQNDVPFLMTGESPQAMIGRLSVEEAELFFQNRRSHGFNTVIIDLVCAFYTGCNGNATTFDGIRPFLEEDVVEEGTGQFLPDLTTPNPIYFERADDILRLAAQYGFLVMLDPAETGSWLRIMRANGVERTRQYGRWVGQRYKDFPNIVWFHGNDYGPPHFEWADNDDFVTALALGIKEADTTHLHTVLFNTNTFLPPVLSTSNPRWRPIIDLNAAYTYQATHVNVLEGYNVSPPMPVFLGESGYEFEDIAVFGSSPRALRAQQYWAILSGATGQIYGNTFTWRFIDGWQDQLDTPGAIQMALLVDLFTPRRWYDLVPDQAHTVVTAGFGTFTDRDYVTAARTPDGALMMAYVPSTRTLTVDMAGMSGPATARWYDPANGTFRAIDGSPFPNTGARQFTTPDANADGDTDWVLVLETVPAPTVTGISPNHVLVGGPDFSLTVNGTNFDPTSVVRVNGTPRSTTFGSSTRLTATVAAADIAVASSVSVSVVTGNAVSNTVSLSVLNPVPSLTVLDPSSAIAGSTPFTLTVSGGNFQPSSVVRWNGADRSTTYVGAATLTAEIPASDIATATTASVTVFTGPPGGGTSMAKPFTVAAAGRVAFTSPTASADETAPSVMLPVTRTLGTAGPVTVDFATHDVTAEAGVDYEAQTGTLTFASGETTKRIVVALRGTPGGGNKTFTVTLSHAQAGLTIGTPSQVTVTIRNVTLTLTAFTPAQGPVGTAVTIVGTNLELATGVLFNGTASSFSALTPTSIRAVVPAGATTGPISALSPIGNPVSIAVFKVTPRVTSLTPDKGTVGASVTIAGASFTGTTSVKFGTAPAEFAVVGDSTITATVPAAATTAPVTVTTPHGSGASAASFLVIRGPAITAFSPARAPEGAAVTITGSNLASLTMLRFNGIEASPVTILSPTSVRAQVPPGTTSGPLFAANAAGTSSSVASFQVAPAITGVSPAQGIPGIPLTITGTTLAGATSVRIGTALAEMTDRTATEITVTVPPSAVTGRVTVTTPGGTATSARDFLVIRPPTITTFAPVRGPVGTVVTISGTNLGSVTGVRFGSLDASQVTVLSSTSIRATVPPLATTGKIDVANASGSTASVAPFTVMPSLTSLAPGRGTPGTIVVITGQALAGATAVRFGAVSAGFTVNGPTELTATVPATAVSAPVSVTTAAGTATSSAGFTVVRPPTITSFSPPRGPVGTVVTLTGPNVGSVTAVDFDGVTASTLTALSATSLRVTVPDGAASGRIHATNESGDSTSATDFILTPLVLDVAPERGLPGSTRVTITGRNLSGATAVRFGTVTAGFTVNGPTELTATVPTTAVSGRISVTTPTGIGTSPLDFIVVRGPTVSSVSPLAGPEGALVTLTGTNLAGAGVAFGSVDAAPATVLSPASIRVVVPPGATTGKLSVSNEAGSVLTAATFVVAPRLVQLAPAAALPGASVTMTGTSLGAASAVRFGAVPASFTVDSASQITARVPATAVTGRVTVTTPGGSATSAADFVVIRPPTVTGFTPARGTSGTVVTISGTNLGSAIAVAFGGGVDAGAITVLSSTSIRVRLPAGALTGRITVVNDAGTAQSAGTFVVVPAISGTGMPSGPTGLPVSILGAGFTGATVVKFGPAIAQFTIVSDGEVSAIVPATAVTGRVSVTTPGGVATSPADFVVTAPGGS